MKPFKVFPFREKIYDNLTHTHSVDLLSIVNNLQMIHSPSYNSEIYFIGKVGVLLRDFTNDSFDSVFFRFVEWVQSFTM